MKFVENIIVSLINLYQRTLSPDHGVLKARFPYGYCRHYPTCSEYTKQAVVRRGVGMGLAMGAKRIAKCNPWAEPSVDPVK